MTDSAEMQLSPRQYEVALLLRQGFSRTQAALKLGISGNTVKWLTTALYRTLGIRSRHELAGISLARWDERPCAHCGRPYTPARVAQRFCSSTCARRQPRTLQRRGPARDCPRCGRTFTGWTAATTYCSNVCATNAIARGLRPRACRACGAEFQPHHRTVWHCSRSCSRITAERKLAAIGLRRRLSPDERRRRQHERDVARGRAASGRGQ